MWKIALIASVVGACSNPPDCLIAVGRARAALPAGESATAVGVCEQAGFSADTRTCLADAHSGVDFERCAIAEPTVQAASAKALPLRHAADGWTPADEAKLAALVTDQDRLTSEMETAFDRIVRADTGDELEAAHAAFDALRAQRSALDEPFAAATVAKEDAADATAELGRACAANPFVAGCHATPQHSRIREPSR